MLPSQWEFSRSRIGWRFILNLLFNCLWLVVFGYGNQNRVALWASVLIIFGGLLGTLISMTRSIGIECVWDARRHLCTRGEDRLCRGRVGLFIVRGWGCVGGGGWESGTVLADDLSRWYLPVPLFSYGSSKTTLREKACVHVFVSLYMGTCKPSKANGLGGEGGMGKC